MPGADFLLLDRTSVPAGQLTGWLTGRFRDAITDGSLTPGTRLPATRALAGDIGVARGVMVEVYRRLAEEGLVEARRGGGTRVLAMPARTGAVVAGGAVTLTGGVPAPRLGAGPVLSADLVTAGSEPGLLPLSWRVVADIDLSPGVPDISAFPHAAWLSAERAVFRQTSSAELGYGDPRGNLRLRRALADLLARTRGLRVTPDDIIIVAGVAQALALLGQHLRSVGETQISVEDPGSRGTRDALAHWGLSPAPVPVDEHGLRVRDIASRGVIVTPAHQFPTGAVLAPERRRALLAWAERSDGLIIEDDYDAEYRYDRAPVPALHPSAPDHVAYTGTTSKTLAPGMRLGWLVPPRTLHAELLVAKHASDLGCPVLPQLVLAELIESGAVERHVRLTRARHRARRDALLSALRGGLPEAKVQGIAAGLHLLVTLPGRYDDVELATRIASAGVVVHPLTWHRMLDGPPGLVLGYAAHPPDRLREAAAVIARCVRAS
jgi:GntR family transcriptional regulator/MocR family aminotransferase